MHLTTDDVIAVDGDYKFLIAVNGWWIPDSRGWLDVYGGFLIAVDGSMGMVES